MRRRFKFNHRGFQCNPKRFWHNDLLSSIKVYSRNSSKEIINLPSLWWLLSSKNLVLSPKGTSNNLKTMNWQRRKFFCYNSGKFSTAIITKESTEEIFLSSSLQFWVYRLKFLQQKTWSLRKEKPIPWGETLRITQWWKICHLHLFKITKNRILRKLVRN